MFYFPIKTIILKRSNIVASRIPRSNEGLDEYFACIFYLMDLQDRPDVPDKVRKHEIRLMFPSVGCKAIDVAVAKVFGRKRGRPRRN